MQQNLDITTQSRSSNVYGYPDVTDKCQHVTKDKCKTDQHQSKSSYEEYLN